MCQNSFIFALLTIKLNTMKRTRLLLAIAFAISVVFTSCGKYEEGPSISLRSKKARLTGVWEISKKMYNGREVSLTAEDKQVTVEFKKDDSFEIKMPPYKLTRTWEFNSDKTKIIVEAGMFGHTEKTELTILRLTNKELFVEEKEDNDVIRSEYNKR